MPVLIKRSALLILLVSGLTTTGLFAGSSADSVILYTPYTKITVTPGQVIDYPVELINNSSELINLEMSLSGLPRGWEYTMKANSFDIRQVSVLPGERRSFNFTLTVPLKVSRGTYRFVMDAGNRASLPLIVVVSEQGTFRTEFVSEQKNMQGPTSSAFSFEAVLKNLTADKQVFALMADAPRGWAVSFSVDFKKVTSVELTANNTARVTIEVDPPDMIEAKLYKIPVRAIAGILTADIDLEVVITGTYAMQLSTPSGLLSGSITAGKQKQIELEVKNTGTAELADIKFTPEHPINWEVTFEPATVARLAPGASERVYAIIKASDKAIAGDYATNIEAKTTDTSSRASFRISVKTPMLWGWVGIFIIAAAAGSVYYLFRKYGRR